MFTSLFDLLILSTRSRLMPISSIHFPGRNYVLSNSCCLVRRPVVV